MTQTSQIVLTLILCTSVVGCAPKNEESLGALFADKRAELEKLPPPAGLKPSEIPTWNAISPRNQRDALEFMKNGGSFEEFMAV